MASNINLNSCFVPDCDQQAFCKTAQDAIRLLAPAGAGKTRSLLWRIREIVLRYEESGKRTEKMPRILVFAFTRAACDELKKRLRSPEFCQFQSNVTVATLNGWGYRYLKNNMRNVRLIDNPYFVMTNILQPTWEKFPEIKALMEDSRRMNRATGQLMEIGDLVKSLGLRHDALNTVDEFIDEINGLLSCGLDAIIEEILHDLHELGIIEHDCDKLNDAVNEMYAHYIPFWKEACSELRKRSMITLEDQKYMTRLSYEDMLSSQKFITGAARYQHILVDEFQDINPLDKALLNAIAGVNKAQITIVGDDDQAIFEWRGATPEYILNPDEHLNVAYQTFVLGTNYRSPKNIVEMSQKLIAHNERRVPKDVHAFRQDNADVKVYRCADITASLMKTVEIVKTHLAKKERVALISRKRSQLIPYQILFAGAGIPFCAAEDLQIFLSKSFESLKEILAIQAHADCVAGYESNPVKDLLKLCDNIKRFPLSKAERASLSRYLYSENPVTLTEACKALRGYTGSLKGVNSDGVRSNKFADAIARLLDAETISEAIVAISEEFEGLQKDYGRSIDDIWHTDPPFLYLSALAAQYGSDYDRFYNDIEQAIGSLAQLPIDDDDDNSMSYSDGVMDRQLHLMTALRAKGKEFDVVIILDANDTIWPSKNAKTPAQLEQERRLFYVAVTRAQKSMYFIVNDSMLGRTAVVTPYLSEMGI